jgi:hypothetical protein
MNTVWVACFSHNILFQILVSKFNVHKFWINYLGFTPNYFVSRTFFSFFGCRPPRSWLITYFTESGSSSILGIKFILKSHSCESDAFQWRFLLLLVTVLGNFNFFINKQIWNFTKSDKEINGNRIIQCLSQFE